MIDLVAAAHRLEARTIRAQVTQATRSAIRDALRDLDHGDLDDASAELQQAAARLHFAADRVRWHEIRSTRRSLIPPPRAGERH